MKLKREEFWKFHEMGVPLENISKNYKTLKVTDNDCGDDDDDEYDDCYDDDDGYYEDGDNEQ